MSYPFQACCGQARAQAFLRASGSGDTSHDIGAKFNPIMRCSSGGVLTYLRPDVFCRIEFGRSRREPVNDQTLVLCQEFLDKLAFVDGVIVPDKNDVARSTPQQLFEKSDYFLAGQTMPVRAYAQLELFSVRQDQQSTDDVETVMMADAGADNGCFATR